MTEPPASDGADYANAAWLVKSHATTVLPSVSSLKALRQLAKASKATKPFIGFGNPLLVGPSGNDRSAWERQNCKTPVKILQVVSRSIRAATPAFFRNGLANVDLVRSQYPLPETADELCAVARSMGAGDDEVYLGAKASERQVRIPVGEWSACSCTRRAFRNTWTTGGRDRSAGAVQGRAGAAPHSSAAGYSRG